MERFYSLNAGLAEEGAEGMNPAARWECQCLRLLGSLYPTFRQKTSRRAPTRRHQKILLIGSGPIVIGQACEFDYSGTQACKALREEGYEVVLVNSNPATIMTDPGDGRSHLHRAAHLGDRREDDREGAARRAAADARRADGAQPGDGLSRSTACWRSTASR